MPVDPQFLAGDAAIEVVGLEKHYGSTRAVDGVSLTVARGEIFALLGPNGAGKTTTVEVLEGYRKPDAGTVRVLGLDPIGQAAELLPRIGVMLQEGGLFPGLKPLEVLRLFAAFYDDPDSPEALLDRMGLGDERRTTVRRLSGGQKQRLSFAAALIGKPQLLFLDEPTAGMDPHARATTWDFVRELRSQGVTIVLTTHLLDEVEAICDRVAIMTSGTIAAIGSPRELTSQAEAHEVSFTTTNARTPISLPDLARAIGLDIAAVSMRRDGEYEVHAPGTPQLIAKLTAFLAEHDIALGSLQANEQSLEDVFLQITRETAP